MNDVPYEIRLNGKELGRIHFADQPLVGDFIHADFDGVGVKNLRVTKRLHYEPVRDDSWQLILLCEEALS